ncbi:MAG: hypothetical protein WBD00_07875 [Candidatus Omnitrophota bacterium]
MDARTHKIWVIILAASIVFCLPVAEALNGWDISLKVDSGNILCVEGKDEEDTIYAGTQKGLYVSRDGGLEWERISLPGGILSVNRIAITPGNVYLATGQGLFKRNGKDIRWDRLPGRKTADGVIASFIRDSMDIVWVWSGEEFFRIKNNEWEKVSHGTSWEKITDVAYIDGVLFVASGGNVYRSPDDGSSWEKIYLDWKRDIPEDLEEEASGEYEWQNSGIGNMCFREHGPLFVSIAKGIFIISKSGNLEDRIDTTGLPASKVKRIACTEGALFASTYTRVFTYSNKGKAWNSYFEESFPGKISFIRSHVDAKGSVTLWIAAGKFLYKRKIDSSNGEGLAYKNDHEPSILEVQRMAIEYAEVSPEKIKQWRKGAVWKAVLPRLSVSVSESYDDNIEIYKNSSTSYVITGPREKGNDWGVDLTWDLSDLIWNDAQTSIDVRSKLMVQLRDDILEEVTRLYFERKRLIAELQKSNVENETKKHKYISGKDLRVEELTAYIDALTGGKFSAALVNK